MPVKRTRAKRRHNPEAEALQWVEVFDAGANFTGDLELRSQNPFAGSPAWVASHLERPGAPDWAHEQREDAIAAYAQASEAWGRLGGIILESGRSAEWALAEFGEPQCR